MSTLRDSDLHGLDFLPQDLVDAYFAALDGEDTAEDVKLGQSLVTDELGPCQGLQAVQLVSGYTTTFLRRRSKRAMFIRVPTLLLSQIISPTEASSAIRSSLRA
jgi:hypothetical protein